MFDHLVLVADRIFWRVVAEDQKSCRFWRAGGFAAVERQPVRQSGKIARSVITMVPNLSAA